MTPLEIARGYIERDWSPVPVPFKQKKPVITGWQNLRITEADASRYFDGAPQNVGIILGEASAGLSDVDLDCAEAVAVAPYFLPQTAAIFVRPGNPSSHWLYKSNLARTRDFATLRLQDPCAARDKEGTIVELRIGGGGNGAQTVFPGSTHKCGEPIEWEADGDPADVDGDDLQRRVERLAAAALLARHWPGPGRRHDPALALGGLLAHGGWKEPAAKVFMEAVARAAGDPDSKDRIRAVESSFERIRTGKKATGFPTLKKYFDERVATRVAELLGVVIVDSFGFARRANGSATTVSSIEVEEPRPPAFTDEALALRFAERHSDNLRYVAAWGRWLHYDGQRWQFDDTLLAFDLARKICRRAASECDKPSMANAIASAKTVAAVERLAKADRRLAATTGQWDADPWLLNTPDGTLDLRSGQLRPHERGDYFTKITAVAPGGECPVWLAHLLRIMDGNSELVSYLQRVFGYATTGSTREHVLYFGYGTGANGKGVTIGTVANILADYHRTAAMETFTASNSDRHPTELAGLRGARLVSANETEQGRQWAESRIKTLTGGDKIEARFMRQDFFEFEPQMKLFIFGNHKPGIASVDEAIRRRLHLIPFTVTIPPTERDQHLQERLKAEWPGILAWMVQGCLAWQRQGLSAPAAVRSATAAYLESEDLFGQWLDDECDAEVGNSHKWEPVGKLFDSWSAYAGKAGEKPGSKKALSEAMQGRGFVPFQQGHANTRCLSSPQSSTRSTD